MKNKILLSALLLTVLTFSPISFAKSIKKSFSPNTAAQVQTQKINLNTAGAKEIANVLTGIGIKKAQAIIKYRKSHGEFKRVEDLAAVKGIGVITLAKNEGRITLK